MHRNCLTSRHAHKRHRSIEYQSPVAQRRSGALRSEAKPQAVLTGNVAVATALEGFEEFGREIAFEFGNFLGATV